MIRCILSCTLAIFFLGNAVAEEALTKKAPKLPPRGSANAVKSEDHAAESGNRPPKLPKRTTLGSSRSAEAGDVIHPPELTIDLNAPSSRIDDLEFSPDGDELAVISDRMVRIYNVADGTLKTSIRGDRSRESYGSVNAVAYSPDGNYLVVGISDDHPRGNIRLYDRRDYSRLISLIPGLSTPCRHLAFSSEGSYLVGADVNGELVGFQWPQNPQSRPPRVIFRLPMNTTDSRIVDKIAFSEDEDTFFAITSSYVRVCSAESEMEITDPRSFPSHLNHWLNGLYDQQYAFLPNHKITPRITDFNMSRGEWAVGAVVREEDTTNHMVGFYSRIRKKNGDLFPDTQYSRHRWEVTSVALSPNGQLAASGDRLGEVHIWNTSSGEELIRIGSKGQPIYNVEYDADSKKIGFTWKEDLDGWALNHYGIVDHVLDLNGKSIHPLEFVSEAFHGNQEITESSSTKLSVLKKRGSERRSIRLTKDKKAIGDYPLRSGNIVSALTMLPSTGQETMGSSFPILYGDSDGRIICWDGNTSKLRRGFRGHEGMITALSVPDHRRFFVSSSVDKTIRFWPTQDFNPTAFFDFEMEDDIVIEVPKGGPAARAGIKVSDKIVSIDGNSVQEFWEKLLAGKIRMSQSEPAELEIDRGGRKLTVQCDLIRGFDYVEPILSLFITQDENWIFWTPEGYYDCSPGADRFIGWHVNQGPNEPAEYFRADQFRDKMYRPDIIQKILEEGLFQRGVATTSSNKKLHKLGDLEEFAKARPPQITWLSPLQDSTTDDDRVEASAIITSENDANIVSVTLLVNGIPSEKLIPRTKEEAKRFEVKQRVKLTPGRNSLVWIAENSHKTTTRSDENTRLITLTSGDFRSNVSALIVGVNDYKYPESGIAPLHFAKNDAEGIAKALETHAKGKLYENVNVFLLSNENATRQGILEALDKLKSTTEPGDTIVLYFSMHGFLDKQERFYLASYDTDLKNLRSTGVAWDDILQFLEEDIAQRKRLVFMDTCHAGGISSSARSPLMNLTESNVGAIFFASSSVSEKSHEDPKWNHGVFTYSVLEALKDEIADNEPDTGDGFLNKSELESYLRKRVQTLTNGRQRPLAYSAAENADFRVFESKLNGSAVVPDP